MRSWPRITKPIFDSSAFGPTEPQRCHPFSCRVDELGNQQGLGAVVALVIKSTSLNLHFIGQKRGCESVGYVARNLFVSTIATTESVCR